jgi:hypothetical protein
MHKLIKEEMGRIQRQFPGKEYLGLNDYALLLGIPRRNAARHLRNTGMPVHKLHTKKGCAKNAPLYVAAISVAQYLVKCKDDGPELIIGPFENIEDEMKSRRGFNQNSARLTAGL